MKLRLYMESYAAGIKDLADQAVLRGPMGWWLDSGFTWAENLISGSWDPWYRAGASWAADQCRRRGLWGYLSDPHYRWAYERSSWIKRMGKPVPAIRAGRRQPCKHRRVPPKCGPRLKVRDDRS